MPALHKQRVFPGDSLACSLNTSASCGHVVLSPGHMFSFAQMLQRHLAAYARSSWPAALCPSCGTGGSAAATTATQVRQAKQEQRQQQPQRQLCMAKYTESHKHISAAAAKRAAAKTAAAVAAAPSASKCTVTYNEVPQAVATATTTGL